MIDGLSRLQAAGVRDGEAYAVARHTVEVMPRCWDRVRPARDAGNRNAWDHMPVPEEINIPGERARGKRPVFGVGCSSAKRNDVAASEYQTVGRTKDRRLRSIADADGEWRRNS